MLKEFLIKKMLQAKLKDVPQAEQDKMMAVISKNPELFLKIGKEVEEKAKSGGDKMAVAMEVLKNYQDEIKKLI